MLSRFSNSPCALEEMGTDLTKRLSQPLACVDSYDFSATTATARNAMMQKVIFW